MSSSVPPSPRRILLTGLPPAIERALREQLALPGAPGTVPDTAAEGPEAPPLDLVITANDTMPEKPSPGVTPGTLRLVLGSEGPRRLGVILRQARQMLEDPALYLAPFSLGDFVFNPPERMLTAADDTEVSLTDREVDIIVYLARHAGRAVPRDDLLRNVWRYQEGVDTHTLETHIYRLRQKIERVAETPEILQTKEAGYRLAL